MADIERLKRALVEADRAGDSAAASQLAAEIRKEMQASSQSQPEATAPRQIGMDPLTASARAAADMAGGFGFTDEMYAALAGLVDYGLGSAPSFGDAFRDRMGKMQGYTNQQAEEFPVATTVGSLAGAAAGAPRLLGEKAAKLVGTSIPALAGSGAVEGAIIGSGYSEGDLGDRAVGAAQGAAIGGVLGGAIPAAVQGVRNIAARRAPTPRAVRSVNRALTRDKLTPQQAAQVADDLGEGATLADAGRNLTGLAEATASRPGAAMDTIEGTLRARADTQAGRILSALDDAAGPPGTSVMRTVESGAWDDVLDKTIPLTNDLKTLMQRPTLRAAYRKAQTLAAEKGESLPPLERVLKDDVKGVQTRVMHWLKKGLDDVLEPKRDAVTGMVKQPFGANQLRAAKATRATFRESVKNLNKDYAKLLETDASSRQIDDAFRLGTEFFKRRNAREIAAQMKRLTPEQARAYRRGVIQAIEDQVNPRAQVGYDVSGQVLRQGEKLRAVFGSKTDDLLKRLQSERKFMLNRNQITGNSRTAFRQAAQDEEAGSVLADVGVDLASGAPLNMTGRVARAARNWLNRPSEEAAQEVAQLLMSQTPQARQQAVAVLTQRYGASKLNDILAAALSSIPASQGGQIGAVSPSAP